MQNVHKPRRRRTLFVVLAVLIVVGTIELLAAVGWWMVTRTPFSWSRAEAARAQAKAGESVVTGAVNTEQSAAQHLAVAGCVQHPYLGYVYDASLPAGPYPISRYGFVDDAPPVRQKAADRYIVGVVGGSVALQLCVHAEAALIAALARSPLLRGRHIEVVRLGLGGYKQPQQLISVQLAMLLGGEFDCIVNVDGFNEVALLNENVPVGVPGWFPRSWSRLMDKAPTPEQLRRLGHLVVLREQRQASADFASGFWWSPLAQLLWFLQDRGIARRLADETAIAERAAVTPSFAITGPGPASSSLEQARVEMAAIWRRCSLQLHTLCESQGIRYFHFLQPNQYVEGSKPIGAEEAVVAIQAEHPWRQAVMHGYPLLQQEGETLRRAGVAFEDLTGIFKEHKEPLYVDICCHVSRVGYEILAEHIAAVMRRRTELDGVVLTGLRVSPPSLQLTSPLVAERLTVYAIETNGTEHDVSGPGFGTLVAIANPSLVAMTVDGQVRALRRGVCELTVRRESHVVVVPVVATWPDLFDGNDGTGSAAGGVPRLELEVGTEAGAALVARCTGLPPGGLRFLGVSAQPLPPVLPTGFDLAEVNSIPLDGSTAPTTTVVAPPPTGAPMFLRVFVLDADGASVLATSNTMVVTRG